MLDAKFVRENPDAVRMAMKSRHATWDVDAFLSLEETRRSLISQVEALQADRNSASKRIGALLKGGEHAEAEAAKEQVALLKDKLALLQDKLTTTEADLTSLLLAGPNIPSSQTPLGDGEDDNPEVRRWGTPRTFDFEDKAHWDIGADLGLIDFERSVKLSGSRFVLLAGEGAMLERALIHYMLDLHLSRGFKEWWPPVILNHESLQGTGQLPKFEEDLFKTSTEGMYLIPTAEVPLTNLHRDEILDADQLPLRYCAFTPCFREEAGSAGRDTRGIIRVHQFDKVEMVKFAKPEESYDELESMVTEAEDVLKGLELPYRVISLCTGDIGFCAAKCYDIEVWLPSYKTYKEISSCSNCEDFQARRANIRYRDPEAFKGTHYVHTLNGSGLAVGRCMAAVIENYQQADGTIKVPDALVSYMGGRTVIGKQA
jgi:seryl-tRNA synthetase